LFDGNYGGNPPQKILAVNVDSKSVFTIDVDCPMDICGIRHWSMDEFMLQLEPASWCVVKVSQYVSPPNPYKSEKDGKWWYDKSEMEYGPYGTEPEAAAVLVRYCDEYLGGYRGDES
jgi:hypothetical protein